LEVKIGGSRIGAEIILKKLEKPYMNAALFHEYISTILLPHIAKVRSNLGLADEPAVPLMDICSDYMRKSTLRDIVAHRVKAVTFPLHTTNIFQSLDLSHFSILKMRINSKLPLDSNDSTAMLFPWTARRPGSES
jgi:hypothetical protein